MIWFLRVLFVVVIGSMVAVTSWAGSHQSLGAFAHSTTFRDPWVIATLFDAYWAFITFYVWVAWKERSVPARSRPWRAPSAGLSAWLDRMRPRPQTNTSR